MPAEAATILALDIKLLDAAEGKRHRPPRPCRRQEDAAVAAVPLPTERRCQARTETCRARFAPFNVTRLSMPLGIYDQHVAKAVPTRAPPPHTHGQSDANQSPTSVSDEGTTRVAGIYKIIIIIIEGLSLYPGIYIQGECLQILLLCHMPADGCFNTLCPNYLNAYIILLFCLIVPCSISIFAGHTYFSEGTSRDYSALVSAHQTK